MIKISEQISEFIKEHVGLGDTHQSISNQIYDVFGVNIARRTVSNHVARLNEPDVDLNVPSVSFKASYRDNGTQLSINADGSQTSSTVIQMQADQIKDVNYVLRAHGFSETDWELVSARNNFWQQNNSEQGLVDLYQSKITVKPKTHEFSVEKFLEQLTNDVKPYQLVEANNKNEKNMVMPLADLHFGITKIADLEEHLHKIIPIIQQPHDTFVIEQLGDLLHSSQMWTTQTMRGTMLDEVDMVQAIEDAKSLFHLIITNINANHIVVKQMAGNHSGNLEYLFMEMLKVKYPNVSVENNVKYRDAYLLGNVGILIAHGDLAKKGLTSLFPTEFKDVWSKSKQHYLHTGHYHNEKLTDNAGIVWQQFGTPKPTDKYEEQNGWSLSKKSMYLLEYSPDELIAEYYV